MKTIVKAQNIKKIYFDNILTSENWAALHFRYSLFFRRIEKWRKNLWSKNAVFEI